MPPRSSGRRHVCPSAFPQPPIEVVTLTELRGLGDDALRALIPLFIADSATRIGRLRRGLVHGELAELGPIAHSLRGSCATFGAYALTALCTDLEELGGGTVDGSRASGIVDAIEKEFGRVRDTLIEELARVGGGSADGASDTLSGRA